ncbi:helix-turn-helix domain-containing protein [Nostoc sp. TCL26-01]|uniref:helix-turn-helix domain-containing protein n=1 Tax=Nostoc sp. TCL26-01 TaxID=2576904 RepID=UPI0015B95D6F|nr:helix-turn-helix domain-containing protein [Nostoc sp. TCL26-01]QLE54877.1 helix-turn-helix domain containing protein [Nostoc sp. TCL26-01]
MSHFFTQDPTLEFYETHESKFLTPFQRKTLLKHLQSNLQPEYRRRIEIILMADVGKSQTQICEILGCSQEMARYWIGLAEAGLAHKWNERPIGRPKIVNAQYLDRLKELVSNSPRDYGYAFSHWTAQWLSKHLAGELGIEISDRHINRLLKQMGLSTKRKTTKPPEINPIPDAAITICDLKTTSEASLNWSFNLLESSNELIRNS